MKVIPFIDHWLFGRNFAANEVQPFEVEKDQAVKVEE